QDFENKLSRNYETWEYCVQYRETACNFVMRLMEQEGIFFFFRHENGKHTLVLADSNKQFEACKHQPEARFEHTAGGGKLEDTDYVYDWQMTQEFRSGAFNHTDYNFETPLISLESGVRGGNNPFEIYDYPGEYEKRSEGETYAGIRFEEERAHAKVVSGASYCRGFEVGCKFDLKEHDRSDQDGQYVLTSISHSASAGNPETGDEMTIDYTNNFTCIPFAT